MMRETTLNGESNVHMGCKKGQIAGGELHVNLGEGLGKGRAWFERMTRQLTIRGYGFEIGTCINMEDDEFHGALEFPSNGLKMKPHGCLAHRILIQW
ncbi:unnamed protein product [Ilex paraguariensis]|uniref:Uncharacterized protein n=1 Tax=Ilex paraguariensis TaxID=185542 RepID=A0ABC8UAP7_9AQUA